LYAGIRAGADSARQRAEARRITGTHPSLALAQYAGSYVDSLVGTISVPMESGALRLRASSTHAATLEHWQYDTFRVRWDNAWEGREGTATFTIGANGTPSRLDFRGTTLHRVEMPRASADSR
jgi:hypothetical protein